MTGALHSITWDMRTDVAPVLLLGVLGLGKKETIRLTPNQQSYTELDGSNRLYRKVE